MQLNFKSVKYKGLTEEDVKYKITAEGYNELPSSKPRNIFAIALEIIKEPMFLLLVAAGTLYLILGDVQEGLLLLCFVFVIMGIEFYQEKKTENALNALKDMASPRALVIRDGTERRIPGREVVTGDIFVLQEGDRVPADAVVLYSVNLMIDESLLTGESVPVRKTEWDDSINIEGITNKPGGDDLPFVYSGSMVVQGNGVLRVTATGMNTELGKIGKALNEVEEESTRLKKEMSLLVKRLAIIGLSLCLFLVCVYTLTRGDIINGFLAGITLAMAMLPEEFPVVLTVFLAIGAWRLSKKNVLTRKPVAIETLGSATVLCTDKTGTLTQNIMSVTMLYNGSSFYDVVNGMINQVEQPISIDEAADAEKKEKNEAEADDYGNNDKGKHKYVNCRDAVIQFPEPFHEIIEFGLLSSQINPFDPMEKAIKSMSDKYLFNTEHIHTDWQMVKEYPLSKNMLAMSRVFINSETNERIIAAKGAPEAIFDLCHLNETTKEKYAKATEQMASSGLRVLGVAKALIGRYLLNKEEHSIQKGLPGDQHDFDFKFIGLIGLSDPIRENVPQAVKECYQAGIRVIMITGDYPITAQNIAEEIGLKHNGKDINFSHSTTTSTTTATTTAITPVTTAEISVYPLSYNAITGDELNSMSDETLCERIKDVNLFARVVPEQKLKIVNALKKNGEVVAMTGDGVNDAPALKTADIGIAMGEKGTDVARESASLVLMDDNFSSIVGAIRMGRRISDNLQKALGYIFAIHVPIAGLSLMPIFFKELPLILWPVHIVFLELIIDPACSIVFEAEQEEQNVMNRPPASVDEPFFGIRKIIMSCTQGLSILAVVIMVYALSLNIGYGEREIRALTFTTLIISNIAVILSNRSWTQNFFKIVVTPNRTVKWVVGGALFFLILSLNVPILMDLFKFDKISIVETIICVLAGTLTIIWFEIYKFFQLKRE